MAKLSGWPKGMDNVHSDNEIPPDALRRAVNLDILDSGKLRRRRGHALRLAVTNGHSLWSWLGRTAAYFVEGNQLKKLNPDATATVIGTVNTGLEHLSYVKVNEDVYFASRLAKGRVRDDVLHPWGIDVPTSPPVLALSDGVMHPGTYFAVMTYVTADGRESGASVQTSITLDAPGGIATTALPVPTDPNVVSKRLYLSTANGEVMYLAKEVPAISQFIVLSSLDLRQELRTQFMGPPPLSIGLAYANGHVFMIDAADPRIVWFTQSLAFDLVDLRKNYYQFPAPVTMIAGTAKGGGLYVSSDKVYFIASPGTLNQDVLDRVAYGFPAIAETLSFIPTTEEPIWLTERGACIGKELGAVQVLSPFSMVPGKMNNAASMVRESDGIRQFVVVGNKTEGSTLEAGSYAEAEITRRQA
jgi:hypothetical protein